MSMGLNEIIRLMTDEKTACEQILELSDQKKDTLIKGDVVLLSEILKKEIELLKKIEYWEIKRDALATSIACQSEVAYRQFSMDDLIELAQGDQREELALLKEQMSAVMKKISDVNEVNKKLIDMQLKYSSFFLNMVTGEVNLGNTYDNVGYIKDVPKSRIGLIDQKA